MIAEATMVAHQAQRPHTITRPAGGSAGSSTRYTTLSWKMSHKAFLSMGGM